VDDQIAVAFFDRFYALSPGLGCARALRQVQLEFIERRIGIQDVDTAQPYFWAGFTLHSGHVE
jgi:CHAT domain-containing protein